MLSVKLKFFGSIVALLALLTYQQALHGPRYPSFSYRLRYNLSWICLKLEGMIFKPDLNTQSGPEISRLRQLSSFHTGNYVRFAQVIQEVASEFDLDPDIVRAVVLAESGFRPGAVSARGASGLMQLLPITAHEMGVSDIFNPRENLRGGCRYLRKQLNAFGGRLDLALAAYNAGPQTVRTYGGVPPYPETRNYVRKILGVYRILKQSKSSVSYPT